MYPLNVLPDNLQNIFSYNFMLPIVEGYHNVFVYHEWPLWETLLYPVIIAVVFVSLGFLTYKKLNKEMVDEL
ncbi:hypothetical protein HMPREF9412_1500 [Paenibacillus sp. HGF5]|nr:hypothetical protein HMPREF9412_1500 [Paenibacillus sp. HGF5]